LSFGLLRVAVAVKLGLPPSGGGVPFSEQWWRRWWAGMVYVKKIVCTGL
jgi:hypothetical protein